MNVRGSVSQRLGEQGIDQPDNRSVILAFQKIFDSRDLLQQSGQIQILSDVARQCRCADIGTVIGGRNQFVELVATDAPGTQGNPQRATQFRQSAGQGIVTHRHLRDSVVQGSNNYPVGFGKRIGNPVGTPIHQLRPESR